MGDRRRSRRSFLGLLGAAAVGAVAGCTAPAASQATESPTEPTPTPTESPETPSAESPYTQVYREAVPSVVLVQVGGPGFGGQGSGFVFDDDGHVLTNQHVVGTADRTDLRYADGEWRTADVLGTDVFSDLAVLRPTDGAPAGQRLPFVDRPPAIGTEVVVIGSPFGLEKSLSRGIVSGVHRAIPTAGGFTIPDAVQTDAAVNPGNSGGPLVTLDGEAVGVIRSAGGENIGFAISAALVKRVAPALIETGRYRHPFMGVGTLDVTPSVAEANELQEVTGILVTTVLDGSPADGVLQPAEDTRRVDGIEVPAGGDVIVGIDDEPVPSSNALGRYLALETSPDETVTLRVVREGRERSVDLSLGTRPQP